MTDVKEQVLNQTVRGFEKVLPHILDGFNLELDDLEEDGVEGPDVVSMSDLPEEVSRQAENTTGFYWPAENMIAVNIPVVKDDPSVLSYSFIGEESSHWLREHYNPESVVLDGMELPENPYDIPPHQLEEKIQEMEQEIQRMHDYTRFEAVDEFFGGIGSRIAARAAGEETNDLSTEGNTDQVITEYTPEEFRDRILDPETGVAALADENLYDIRDGVFHIAGYRAAEENFEQALRDDDLIRKSSEQIHSEYGIDQLELEVLKEIYEFS